MFIFYLKFIKNKWTKTRERETSGHYLICPLNSVTLLPSCAPMLSIAPERLNCEFSSDIFIINGQIFNCVPSTKHWGFIWHFLDPSLEAPGLTTALLEPLVKVNGSVCASHFWQVQLESPPPPRKPVPPASHMLQRGVCPWGSVSLRDAWHFIPRTDELRLPRQRFLRVS